MSTMYEPRTATVRRNRFQFMAHAFTASTPCAARTAPFGVTATTGGPCENRRTCVPS